MKLFEGFDAQKVIMIVIAAVVVIQLASMVWVGEAEGYVSFTQFESKPIFEILIVGIAILAGYAIVSKVQGGTMTLKHIATLVILGIGFYLVWTQLLGSPTISLLASAIRP